MSYHGHTNKSSCFRQFTQRPSLTNHRHQLGHDSSYDDLPVGSEVCDASTLGRRKPRISHKQNRSANKKAAAYREALGMHHKLCNSANKKKSALTPPAKRHGETLNSYRARVAKWEKKNGISS